MKYRVICLGLVLMCFLAGCASLAGIRHSPDITLAGLDVAEIGLLEQRFVLKLRIQNPNDVDLPINGMRFDVELNGLAFAKGLSDKAVTVPRLGEIVLEVTATSTLGTVWRQLRELQREGRDRVTYRLEGRVLLPTLGSVPFVQAGDIAMP